MTQLVEKKSRSHEDESKRMEQLSWSSSGTEIESKHNAGRENLDLLRTLIPNAIKRRREKGDGRFRIWHTHMDTPTVSTKQYWMHPDGIDEIKIQTNGEKPKLTYKQLHEQFGPIFVRTEKKVESEKENYIEEFKPYLINCQFQGEVVNQRYSMTVVERSTNRVLRITLDMDDPTSSHIKGIEAVEKIQMEIEYEGIFVPDADLENNIRNDISGKDDPKIHDEIIPLIIDMYSFIKNEAELHGVEFQDGQRKADRFAL